MTASAANGRLFRSTMRPDTGKGALFRLLPLIAALTARIRSYHDGVWAAVRVVANSHRLGENGVAVCISGANDNRAVANPSG